MNTVEMIGKQAMLGTFHAFAATPIPWAERWLGGF